MDGNLEIRRDGPGTTPAVPTGSTLASRGLDAIVLRLADGDGIAVFTTDTDVCPVEAAIPPQLLHSLGYYAHSLTPRSIVHFVALKITPGDTGVIETIAAIDALALAGFPVLEAINPTSDLLDFDDAHLAPEHVRVAVNTYLLTGDRP